MAFVRLRIIYLCMYSFIGINSLSLHDLKSATEALKIPLEDGQQTCARKSVQSYSNNKCLSTCVNNALALIE